MFVGDKKGGIPTGRALPLFHLYVKPTERVYNMRKNRTERRLAAASPSQRRQSPGPESPAPVRRREKAQAGTVAALVIIIMALASAAIVVFAMLNAGKASSPQSVEVIKTIPRAAQEGRGTPVGLGDGGQLDDPLLVLVNDVTPLPDNWQVTPAMIGDETVDQRAYADLDAMFQAAGEENVWLWVASGYRSVAEQEEVLSQEISLHMSEGMTEDQARELSLRTIARPGYSEHHTGLAVDINDVSDNFESTTEYKWLSQHAAEYGFVQRYRSDKVEKTGIDTESWHYRYVGREHAQEMERLDMCLEEYVEYLKSQTNY